MALGENIPGGLLPTNNIDAKEQENTEYYPASVAEKPILGEHMALIPTFRTYCSNYRVGRRNRAKKLRHLRIAISRPIEIGPLF